MKSQMLVDLLFTGLAIAALLALVVALYRGMRRLMPPSSKSGEEAEPDLAQQTMDRHWRG